MLHNGSRFVATFYAVKIAVIAWQLQSFCIANNPLASSKKIMRFELVTSVKAASQLLLPGHVVY